MEYNEYNIGDLVHFTDNNLTSFESEGWQLKFNTFWTDVNTYYMLACNRFKWESSEIEPKDRLSKLIEFYLNTKGQCFITKETKEVLQGCISEKYDKFGRPEGFYCFGYNGESDGKRFYKYDDVIWIKNNYLRIPTLYWIFKYCKRINEVEKTMDLNLQALKTPWIIETDPLINQSVKMMFQAIDNLSKCILTDKQKSLIDNIKILKLDTPYLIRDLYDQKINEENNLLQILGIDTINEKNAHMLYAEVQNSNEITDNYTDIFVSERKIAVEEAEKAGIDLHLSMLEVDFDVDELNGTLNGGEQDAEQNPGNITEID